MSKQLTLYYAGINVSDRWSVIAYGLRMQGYSTIGTVA